MKRVLGLAYLLVWAWYEHSQAAQLLGQDSVHRLVILLDPEGLFASASAADEAVAA